MSLSTKTICWPLGVPCNGFCYGWTDPVICVAGVIQGKSAMEAKRMLEAAVQSRDWLDRSPHIADCPLLLGTSVYDESGEPKLCFFDSVLAGTASTSSNLQLLYFHRHDIRSMRFYSLRDFYLDSIRPTRENWFPHKRKLVYPLRAAVIDDAVVNKMNLSRHLDNVVNSASRPPSRSGRCISLLLSLVNAAVNAFVDSVGRVVPAISPPKSQAVHTLWSTVSTLFATLQQVDVRISQSMLAIHHYQGLNTTRRSDFAAFSRHYVHFYNSVWLISNDIVIGRAFGTFLCENKDYLAELLFELLQNVVLVWIRDTLVWLDSWPAGLKLNTDLSAFYCRSFIHMIALWSVLLRVLRRYLPSVLYIVGLNSVSGMTMAISLAQDFMAFLTIPITICYLISTVIYRRCLRLATSLWNLFRGKRFNVLRRRLDSWDYDLDQLLFGTILFTLIAFLFPTILVYYLLFALLRLTVITLYASMDVALVMLNHFPLFMLVLRFKDPWRLSSGIFWSEQRNLQTGNAVVLESQPIQLSSIFFQYSHLWHKLSSHYHPLHLLIIITSGEYLKPIPRHVIRYDSYSSSIP